MVSISVALATFNEEKNIRACLESVADFTEEIVIVDGTSSDRTVKIAKEFGAKVTVRENPKIFHINKQIAIDKCTKDWILQLDADEHISKELRDEIENIIHSNPKENGFWIPRKNYFLGRFLMKGGQYPDYTIRLYRNGKGHLPQKDVHEQAEVTGEVGYLKNPLLHYPYENFSAYYKKWDRYTDLLAMQFSEKYKNKKIQSFVIAPLEVVIKPIYWMILSYGRHKGFLDSWQGFVFSFFSSLRYPVSYIKYIGRLY